MKKRKPLLWIVLILLCIFPAKAQAIETKEYHVCQNNCEYNNLEDVFYELKQITSNEGIDVNIYLDDDNTYELIDYNYINNKKSRWENGQLKSRFYNVSIKGTDKNKAKIISSSLHEDFNYVERGLFINVWENLTIENIDIDTGNNSILLSSGNGNVILKNTIIRSSELYTYFTTKKTIVEDSSLYGFTTFDDAEITNCNLYNGYSVGGGIGVLKDVNIEGNVTVQGAINFKNVNIHTNSEIGIDFIYSDCGCDCSNPYYENDSYLDNVVIKGSSVAVNYEKGIITSDKKLYINNSDLSDSDLSIHMENIFTCGSNKTYDDYSVISTNSKLSGAYTTIRNHENEYYPFDDNNDFHALNMYFDYTNTWTKTIKRLNSYSLELPFSPVIEENEGNIVVEQANKTQVAINIKDKNLSDLFDDVSVSLKDEDWKVTDQSILKIENGKIIPLKVGETDISCEINNDVYYLRVIVTDLDLTNPSTNPNRYIIILILGFVGTSLYITKKKKFIKE